MSTRTGERVRTKRIYEAPSPDDGYRVLATRYWPRGVAKDAIDEYVPTLAPSRELLRSYRDGDIPWEQFHERYIEEMRGEEQTAEIHRLARRAWSDRITLLCVCDEDEKCHRWLLQDLVARFDDGP